MKKVILLIVTLISSSLLIAAPIKTVRFATEATYPPFEYADETGKLKGFDIEIATALCTAMQAQCIFTNQSFNSLIPSLMLGKFDALIAGLGVTEERKKQVAFTNAYYTPTASIVAPINRHYKLSDMTGKSIGVQQGSTFEKYLLDKYGKQMIVKSYASIQDAFLDLIAERVDMVLADTTLAQMWIQQNSNSSKFTLVGQPITDAEYFGTGYGIAVRKDNVALLQALNKALDEIKANGTYDRIIKAYFGG